MNNGILVLLLTLIYSTSHAQYYDVPPSGKANTLPVEGCSKTVKLDTTKSLSELVNSLNSDWDEIETGKFYWYGYTPEMFSIAQFKDQAIDSLLHFYRNRALSKHAKYGALLTIHLIGINSTVIGRTVEEFKNVKARNALLELLEESSDEDQYQILFFLIRDPWPSDLLTFEQILIKSDNSCWPIINSLYRYISYNQVLKNEKLPYKINFSDGLDSIIVKGRKFNENDTKNTYSIADFEKRIEHDNVEIERLIRENSIFIVDSGAVFDGVFYGGGIIYDFDELNISSLLADKANTDQSIFGHGYLSVGGKIQYEVSGNKIRIISYQRAKKEWINWINKNKSKLAPNKR